jgi:hypothetical protein
VPVSSGKCPACHEKGLKGHPDRGVVEGIREKRLVNPAWLWWECVRCGARFKERHYGDGALQAVADQEWWAGVASSEPSV